MEQQRIEMMLDEIQKKRNRMIETARKSGFTSADTIRQSQELDRLIYEYQCLSRNYKRKKKESSFTSRKTIFFWPKQRTKYKLVNQGTGIFASGYYSFILKKG